MQLNHLRRPFTVAFTLTLAAVLGLFAYSSSAVGTGAVIQVRGETSDTCRGSTVRAAYQDSVVSLELQQFWPGEPVYVSLTFPDGRVLSPVVTSFADINSVQPAFTIDGVPLNGLDGVIDMPANFPWVQSTSSGGDYAFPFPVTNRWPYGCYTFTALGAWSNRQAQATFAVRARPLTPPPASPASLVVEDNTTGDRSSQQGAFVNIFGRSFIANELVSIWITAPDGTVFPFPYQPLTSDIGSFSVPFIFDANHPTGRYHFTALGTYSGYQVISTFELSSRSSPTGGFAELQAVAPSAVDGVIEVRGKLYWPYERVDVWLTLPDGAVRGLPSQFANDIGEFFATFTVDQRLPTGEYDITAKGAASGYLKIATFEITAGDPNVLYPVDPYASPFVFDSNTDAPGTLGPPPETLPPFESPADPIFPDF